MYLGEPRLCQIMLAAEIGIVLPRRQDTHMTPLHCKTAVSGEPKAECGLFIHKDKTGLKKCHLFCIQLIPCLKLDREGLCVQLLTT